MLEMKLKLCCYDVTMTLCCWVVHDPHKFVSVPLSNILEMGGPGCLGHGRGEEEEEEEEQSLCC